MGYTDFNTDDTREQEGMRKMFVGGISRSTTDDVFGTHFAEYGEIVDKVIIKDMEKNSRGFGFVTYAQSNSVEAAFAARPHTLDGKELDVKRAIPRDLPEGAHSRTKKLFIGGIGPDTTEQDILTYIENRHPTEYGSIEKCDILKDQDGKNKTFGFLTCSSIDFADRLTISEQSVFIKGKKMGIKKAEPKPGEEGAQGGGRGGGRGRGGSRGRGGARGGFQQQNSYGGGGGGGYGQQSGYGGAAQQYSTAYPTAQYGGGASYGQVGGGYAAASQGYGAQQSYGQDYGQAYAGGYGKPQRGGAAGGQRYQPY